MKGLTKLLVVFSVLFGLSTPLFGADYKPGEIIVKFKPRAAAAAAIGLADTTRPYTVAVDDTEQALGELAGRDDIAYAEPNYVITAETVPADWPYTASEWADVGLSAAWNFIDTRPAGATVRIAVVDSGADLDHPELADVLIDGHDFANDDNTPEDDAGHGTRVCGVIGAKGNNAGGVAGVAWDVPIRIMPLKFMKKSGSSTSGYTSDAVDAIYYAVNHGAKVINASWGFDSYSSALKDAIAYARDHGVLFVASAGNNGTDNDTVAHYPSNYQLSNIIAVAAMNRYGELASFSNYGANSVHIAAPGSGLKTTDLDGGTTSWASGTSFAAPWVSAVAAMVESQNPDLSMTAVRTRILEGSLMESDYGETLLASGGCLNAYNALAAVKVHDLDDTSGWTAPQAQTTDDGSASGEGGGGGGCFIHAAQTSGGLLLFLAIIPLAALFRVPPRQQE